MAHIDYFTFTLSPFSYLAGGRLEEIAAKHGATITYKPFGLLDIFERTGTLPPGKRHISRQVYRGQDLVRVAKMNDMPLTPKPAFWPTNPAPSCYAIIAAQKVGGGDVGGLCQSILRACWAEDKDIADESVVRACLEANGFDGDLVNHDMMGSADEYAANTEEAMTRNVFGAPMYVVGDELFWGQDRLAHLDAHLATL